MTILLCRVKLKIFSYQQKDIINYSSGNMKLIANILIASLVHLGLAQSGQPASDQVAQTSDYLQTQTKIENQIISSTSNLEVQKVSHHSDKVEIQGEQEIEEKRKRHHQEDGKSVRYNHERSNRHQKKDHQNRQRQQHHQILNEHDQKSNKRQKRLRENANLQRPERPDRPQRPQRPEGSKMENQMMKPPNGEESGPKMNLKHEKMEQTRHRRQRRERRRHRNNHKTEKHSQDSSQESTSSTSETSIQQVEQLEMIPINQQVFSLTQKQPQGQKIKVIANQAPQIQVSSAH